MTTRLLLVDDDAFVRGALARALNRTGAFSVVAAEHGQQALDLLGAERVSAILTDLQMPVMDGLTMIGRLFERGIRLPVAIMTGHAISSPLAQRLHEYGIAASFTKPVNIGSLADELQRALNPEAVGRITGITLFGFLQLLEVERKTAMVVVSRDGRLYFDEGRLVHAYTHRLQGLEAVYAILSWADPTVEIFYDRQSRERTIREPLQHVLMEAARLLDESGRRPANDATETGVAGADGPRTLYDAALVEGVLDEAKGIDGVLGVALVHAPRAELLGSLGGRVTFDLKLAATAATEIMRAERRWHGALDTDDAIEDTIITLGKRYHLIRPVGATREEFLYLVLSRDKANLGLVRRQLAKLARRFEK